MQHPTYIVEWVKERKRWVLFSNGGGRKEMQVGRSSPFKYRILSRAKWHARRNIPSRMIVMGRNGLVIYEKEFTVEHPKGLRS